MIFSTSNLLKSTLTLPHVDFHEYLPDINADVVVTFPHCQNTEWLAVVGTDMHHDTDAQCSTTS